MSGEDAFYAALAQTTGSFSFQEAAEAKENQRVDRAAKEMYKGYFENLRKDAEKDLKK